MSVVPPPKKKKLSAPAKSEPVTAEPKPKPQGSLSPGRVTRNKPSRRKWMTLALALVAVTVAIGGFVWWLKRDGVALSDNLVLHTVERGVLEVVVTERGNLESQINETVLCEVDDAREDGVHGTPIIWLIENGASVKKGDLIVELDASPIQELLDRQMLDVEEELAEFLQAEVSYENQQTQNLTTLKEAELEVELAELALRQFGDNDAGTFQIELQDVELMIQEAEAGQLIEQTNLSGVEELYKLGYRSSGELAEARLSSLRSERQLATARSKKRELVEYVYKKTLMELEGKLASAKRKLNQVELDNKAQLAQAKARLESSREQLGKERERLERYKSQIGKCKIYAPQDGMVAYYSGGGRYRREEIREGATVRPRQPILTLPNLEKMQVKTAVHESVLDQISSGLKATVRVDAFPDSKYPATVATVAVLPDQGGWMSSDTKVYETVVTIDQDVKQLKPGMTAVVEIDVARLDDVVSIPVQAIVQVDDKDWCYVSKNGKVERRELELGMTNSKYVEVREGLEEGEQIVLNPSAIPGSFEASVEPKPESDDEMDMGDESDETFDGDSGLDADAGESPSRGPSGRPAAPAQQPAGSGGPPPSRQ